MIGISKSPLVSAAVLFLLVSPSLVYGDTISQGAVATTSFSTPFTPPGAGYQDGSRCCGTVIAGACIGDTFTYHYRIDPGTINVNSTVYTSVSIGFDPTLILPGGTLPTSTTSLIQPGSSVAIGLGFPLEFASNGACFTGAASGNSNVNVSAQVPLSDVVVHGSAVVPISSNTINIPINFGSIDVTPRGNLTVQAADRPPLPPACSNLTQIASLPIASGAPAIANVSGGGAPADYGLADVAVNVGPPGVGDVLAVAVQRPNAAATPGQQIRFLLRNLAYWVKVQDSSFSVKIEFKGIIGDILAIFNAHSFEFPLPFDIAGELGGAASALAEQTEAYVQGYVDTLPEALRPLAQPCANQLAAQYTAKIAAGDIPIPLISPPAASQGAAVLTAAAAPPDLSVLEFSIPTDSDEDGLFEGEEIAANCARDKADTDNDGLSDYREVRVYHTRCDVADSDQDGYDDPIEVRSGCDALDAAIIPPQAVGTTGTLGDGVWNGLLTYAAPTSRIVDRAADPSCGPGVCGEFNFCTSGRIGDLCAVDGDCTLAENTCRLLVNYSTDENTAIKTAWTRQSRGRRVSVLDQLKMSPGCTQKLDLALGSTANNARGTLVRLVAKGTIDNQTRLDVDMFRYR